MIGSTFSHYEITEKLDERGMGVVYAAEDTSLKRPVLLKSLVAHLLGDEDVKALLRRRAEVAARHGIALGLTAVFLLGVVALSADFSRLDRDYRTLAGCGSVFGFGVGLLGRGEQPRISKARFALRPAVTAC